jgi:hypothetical protein
MAFDLPIWWKGRHQAAKTFAVKNFVKEDVF